jgi:hypothetical protein
MFEAKPDARAFDKALDEFGAKLKRQMDFMGGAVEEWFYRTEREQFATQGAAGRSGRWQPHAAATARRKAIEGRGFQLLVDRGGMRDALTGRGGLGSLIERSGDRIVFRLPQPAGFHQTGTRRMPARKVVDPSDAQVRRLGEDVGHEAAKMIRGLGIDTKEG